MPLYNNSSQLHIHLVLGVQNIQANKKQINLCVCVCVNVPSQVLVCPGGSGNNWSCAWFIASNISPNLLLCHYLHSSILTKTGCKYYAS